MCEPVRGDAVGFQFVEQGAPARHHRGPVPLDHPGDERLLRAEVVVRGRRVVARLGVDAADGHGVDTELGDEAFGCLDQGVLGPVVLVTSGHAFIIR